MVHQSGSPHNDSSHFGTARRGIAGGVASLDGNARLFGVQLTRDGTNKLAFVKTGTYTGNGTQNRDIAHGCGITPYMVFIQAVGLTGVQSAWVTGMTDTTLAMWAGGSAQYGVISVNDTNIRVGVLADGSSLNTNTKNYFYICFYHPNSYGV